MAPRNPNTSRSVSRHTTSSPSITAAFERAVHHAWLQAVGIAGGTQVLVAVSGGADSMSLLYALHRQADVLALSLVVAHVDHGLRGMASDADAAFVAAAAARLGLHCELAVVEIAAGRRKRESPESAARRLRYEALRRIAASRHCSVIATGHTLDDQAETVLLQLIRGAGIDGLGGMRARTNEIVRPLLGITRREVLAYLDALAIDHREDATNADRGLRRNAIRADLIPMLERFNPRIRQTLARTATTLARDASFVEREARKAFEASIRSRSRGSLILDRAALRSLATGLRQHVIRVAIDEAGGSLTRCTLAHVESIDRLIVDDAPRARVSAPRGLLVETSGTNLVLATAARIEAPPRPIALGIPGTVRFGAWVIAADESRSSAEFRDAKFRLAIRRERAQAGLLIRARLPGDRMRLAGMKGHKSLQDLFVDCKLPRGARAHYPIVTDGSTIIWVPGLAMAADALHGVEGDEVVELTATRDIGLSG